MRRFTAAACCCVLVAIAGCGGSTRPPSASTTASSATTASATSSSATASTRSTTSGRTGRGDHSAAASTAPLARYYGSLATFGSEASGGDRAAVLAALHGYLSAIAAGDWGAACEQLSAPIQHQLELLIAHAKAVHGRGCAAALGALLAHAPSSLRRQQAQLNVLAVRINSDRAFVLYRSPQLPHAVISMLREAGRWKAGVLAGSNTG
jgi:hypothetical protein